jgi:hypothetical protein
MNKILPAKFRQNEKNKNKNGIFCHNILVLKKRKKRQNLRNFYYKKLLPYLDSAFSLIAVFLLFRQVQKTCRHLMLNLSWDANQ